MFRTLYKSAQIFLLFCRNILTDRRTDGQNSHRYTASAFHVARQKLRWQSAAILVIRRFDVTGGQLEKQASQTIPYINDN